jgi:hypothetical protein
MSQFRILPALLLPALLIIVVACQPKEIANKSWTLLPDQSSLSLDIVKAETVHETFSLRFQTGKVGPDGKMDLQIDLNSIETNIDIRNERMRVHLFDLAKWPTAQVQSQIDLTQFQDLKIGKNKVSTDDIQLLFNGISMVYDVETSVSRISETQISIQNTKPVIITASELEFTSGLEKLRQLAKLPSISPKVEVNFTLVLDAG